MNRRVRLIVNPSAGGGRAGRLLPGVRAALDAQGIPVEVALTGDLDHARRLAGDAAAAGQVSVTLGGDGLIGAVAEALRAQPGSVMGILPGGRGNDVARVLRIPRDPIQACQVLWQGVERPLDLGAVDGRSFVGVASAGFDSEANRIANEAPPQLGSLVYAYGALRALVRWRPARFEIELDPPGERHSFLGYGVAAANSRAYGGGMLVAPDAVLNDGLLEVVFLEDVSRRRFLTGLLPRVFRGTHVELPDVHVFRAAAVQITADRPFALYADGDPIGSLPALIRAEPAAVRVLVPDVQIPALPAGSTG